MIREIHLRRYLLQKTALEIFFIDQTNAFFHFPGIERRREEEGGGGERSGGGGGPGVKEERDKLFAKLVGMKLPNLVFAESGSPEEVFNKSGLMRKWQRGEISNFDYLMQVWWGGVCFLFFCFLF